ncbi:MAG: hypothetical protein CVV49_15120 [Spirochaetae bacterium HGW-Spirochaetae-5]|nr:MAG: hypothetical protein CVV49_15120 [Spirochaetae bacterium HGW-Spirochaetae-5]
MPGDTESLTPSDVNLFVKSKEITKMIKTVNYMLFNLMDEQQRGEFIAERDKFRDKTGIDYFDEKSLRNAGIDTNRPVSFANFDKDNIISSTGEVMLIFLPVLNEKDFPLKFIELIKKANAGNPAISITSVTASYKNITVYQVKDDLYIAGANGYLLIGSTSDIIRRVIDVRESRSGSLILDGNYKDYLSKGKNVYDLNAFMTKKFIMQLRGASQGTDEISGIYSMKNFILSQGESAASDLSSSSVFDTVDYIAAGAGLDGNKLRMNASAKLTADNPYVNLILGFLKTGVEGKSLYVPSTDTALFMSMNLKYLDNLCKGEIEWCGKYNAYKEQIKKEWGVDLEKDFIPYHTGGINMMTLDSGSYGGMGDILLFIPMTDSKKTEELWQKMRKGVQTKYGKNKKFGEEKIGSRRGFWYIDESQMRFFVSYDQRGIYAGNSTGLMKSAHTGSTVETASNMGSYGKIINGNTFFLLNIKKNAFLKMMMQMRAQGNPDAAKVINRIGEIFLFCEKKDGLVSMDFEVEIKAAGNKK